MDAINPREIIAMSIRNGGRANSYNKALYAISDLEAHGYQIIHRDENHGPTLERCAKLADDPWAVTPSEHATGERLCEGISTAIRAMGEKK